MTDLNDLTDLTAAPARLVLLSGTHRVAPGLLSWPAWRTLREVAAAPGGQVRTGDPGHPQLPYVREAGVPVTVVDATDPGRLARTLLADAATAPVVWITAPDGDPELGPALAAAAAESADAARLPEIELLPASWDVPGARFVDLVEVMDRLRSPGGCPWDARQTHASLTRYLVEEAYELVDAIESGDRGHLREELGDVLFQVVFHARVAQEDPDDPFDIDDVAGDIVEKLMNRHPHVFGDVVAETAEEVERNWAALKAAEKGRASAVDGIALAQPALSLGAKLMSRAAKAGLDVPAPPVPEGVGAPKDEDAAGDLLLAVTALVAGAGFDPETALRAAAMRHRDRIRAAEAGTA